MTRIQRIQPVDAWSQNLMVKSFSTCNTQEAETQTGKDQGQNTIKDLSPVTYFFQLYLIA